MKLFHLKRNVTEKRHAQKHVTTVQVFQTRDVSVPAVRHTHDESNEAALQSAPEVVESTEKMYYKEGRKPQLSRLKARPIFVTWISTHFYSKLTFASISEK